MTTGFGRGFWEDHWRARPAGRTLPAHPALEVELGGVAPGTALDAGAGEGAEAAWLAAHGWDVTAVDISAHALARAETGTGAGSVRWVEADLTQWEPAAAFDLVTTFYAHPAMPQDAFYARISRWVAPGGTLLIVGHDHAYADGPPVDAVTGPERARGVLAEDLWRVRTAETRPRTVLTPSGAERVLHDVVVTAVRR